MSRHAVQALLAAAAEDTALKERLLGVDSQAVIAEVLTLSPEELTQVQSILQNQDTQAPTEMPVEQRDVPGPGIGGNRF